MSFQRPRSSTARGRTYRISIWMVLKQAWKVHGIDGQGLKRGQRKRKFTSIRSLSRSNRGKVPRMDAVPSESLGNRAQPELAQEEAEIEVASVLRNFDQSMEMDSLLCSEALCGLVIMEQIPMTMSAVRRPARGHLGRPRQKVG